MTFAAFAIALVAFSTYFWIFAPVTLDDSFIVFRVVENWLAGEGPRFNADDPHFIVTSPLWLLLLTSVKAGAPGVGLAWIAKGLAWLLLVLASLALFDGLRRDSPVASVLAPAAVFCAPAMPSLAGHDTACALAAGVALWWCHRRDYGSGIAVAGAAFYLARGEGALLAALLAIHYVVRGGVAPRQLRSRIRQMGPGLALAVSIVGGWHAYHAFEFGAWFPATLAAKIAQGQATQWPALASSAPDHLALIAPGPVAFLAAVGCVVLALRHWVLIAWPIIHISVYAGLGVPYYHWYYYPVELVAMLAVFVGVESVVRLAARAFDPKLRSVRIEFALALALAVAVVPGARAAVLWRPGPVLPALRDLTIDGAPGVDARWVAYQEIAAWIRVQPEAPGAVLLAPEVGILGHALAGLEVRDVVGLATPDVPVERLFDYAWHIERYQPDFVLIKRLPDHRNRVEIRLPDGTTAAYVRAFTPSQRYHAAAIFRPVRRPDR